jgi:TonB dependent receptor
VEDNSARSPQYTPVDGQIGFQQTNQWQVTLDVFNIANVKWNDIEYYYVSRLKNEVSAQPDFVVHPGVPRTFRAHFTYYF